MLEEAQQNFQQITKPKLSHKIPFSSAFTVGIQLVHCND